MNYLKKRPIIIVSSARTGSSVFADYLAKKFSLNTFIEPKTRNEVELDNYINKNCTDYVLKFHAIDFQYYENLDIFNNAAIIACKRKNIINQIASYYVAHQKNKWFYKKWDVNLHEQNAIELIESDIIYAVNKIIKFNYALENFHLDFDAVFHYEDLDNGEFYKITNFVETPKPKNYESLKNNIKCILKTYELI